MKKLIIFLFCAVFLFGCITRQYVLMVNGDGNTVNVTVSADVPKNIQPNATVSVVP